MEQQHSAHTGGKDPGQGPGQGQEQGSSPNREHPEHGEPRQRPPRGTKPRSADGTGTGAGIGAKAGTGTGTENGAGAGTGHGKAAQAASPARSSGSAAHAPGSATSASREARRRAPAGAVRQEAAALYQAQLRFPLIPAPLTDAVSWLPRARLTALGSGLLGVLLMVLTGAADRWLLDGSPTVYGCAFLVTSVACAAWVRPTDLVAAPVAVPLAFTAGLFFISGGAGGQSLTDRVTNLFPALAVNAVWLYAGTLAAALLVSVRKVALMVQQSRVRALMEAEDAEEEAAEGDSGL